VLRRFSSYISLFILVLGGVSCTLTEDTEPTVEVPYADKRVELQYNVINQSARALFKARFFLYDPSNVTLGEVAEYESPEVTGEIKASSGSEAIQKITIPLPDLPKTGNYYRWVVIEKSNDSGKFTNQCGGGGHVDMAQYLKENGTEFSSKIIIEGGTCRF